MVQISLALTWPMIRSSVCDLYGCSWGGGATALLLAQLFFFFASVFTRCMREPRYVRVKKRREEEEIAEITCKVACWLAAIMHERDGVASGQPLSLLVHVSLQKVVGNYLRRQTR